MKGHLKYLEEWLVDANNQPLQDRLEIRNRLEWVKKQIEEISQPGYLESLTGTLGTQPRN